MTPAHTLTQTAHPFAATAPRPLSAGMRDALPMVITLIPFALAVGAAIASTSVPAFTGWFSSWLVVGGAAQLVTVQLLDSGAGPAVLGAMVVPALVLPGGSMSIQATVPTILAAAACGIAFWRSGSMPLALIIGLLTAWAAGAALSI